MSIVKDVRNLSLGNGDVFLRPTVGELPSRATYKTALANGTLGNLAGNVGGVKGTVNINIVREILGMEIGIPQEVVDQTVIREGITFKCSLAEMDLVTIRYQLGIPDADYTTEAAGATLVNNEAITFTDSAEGEPRAFPILKAPVLLTNSTPAATANPKLTKTGGGVAGATVPFTASATGTGTLTPNSGTFSPTLTTLTVGGTAAGGQVYTVVFGNGLYTVSYTAQGAETNTNIATGLAAAINGTVGTGRVISQFVKVAFTGAAATNTVDVTQIAYLQNYDFAIETVTNTITRLQSGSIADGTSTGELDYYYNQASTEIITGGGRASIVTSAVAFFHPYKDGRASMFQLLKANPTGGVTLPFEEVAYSTYEFEMRAISDSTKAAGQHLYRIERELPT